jgi:hypothetical protein
VDLKTIGKLEKTNCHGEPKKKKNIRVLKKRTKMKVERECVGPLDFTFNCVGEKNPIV